jgi:hypothetical protein
MGMEIGKQVKVILAGGEALAHEIEAAIRDIVISNATGIERFHERHEELTKVDHQFLFFYAVGLVLVFTSGAGSWTEEEINSVIDKAAEEIVREMHFRTAGQGDLEGERRAIGAQLRNVFENIRSRFRRLEEIGEEKERSEASFTVMLRYLTQVYPAFATLFGTGNTELLAKLEQSFALISISAHRYVSD